MKRFADVFPLRPGTKLPAVKWSQPWEGVIPEGETYGLPTGPRNGVWVLDIDRKNGKDGLRELIAYADAGGHDLPDTYTVRTPSGGLHLYWQWDNERPIGNRAGVLPGLDVRGAGGFVCAGGAYVDAVDSPIMAAPAWLFELVGLKADVEVGDSAIAITPDHPEWSFRLKTAKAFLEHAEPCVKGEGLSQAKIWAISLRLMRTYELPLETALRLLAPYNARCTPSPYWTEKELIHNLTRAVTHGEGPTGMFPEHFMLGATSPAQSAEEGVTPLPALEKSSAGSSESWRRRAGAPRAGHSFSMTESVAGGADKLAPYSPKELAAVFTGPSAAPPWVGVWQWDVFRRRTVAVDPPMPLDAETIGLTEADKVRIQVWLNCIGIKASLDAISNAIVVAASCAQYHPIVDYLDGLPRVPVEQAAAYFEGIAGRLWGSPEGRAREVESDHVRRMAIAAVRRIRQPGVPVQEMLVLAGAQGYRKSFFCKKLFGEFFRDHMPPLKQADRDVSIALEGYWGVEFAELAAFGGALEAVKKEFISRAEDKYRPVYAEGTLVIPRQSVFIGTTNEDDFLDDPTGASRYNVCEITQPIDLDSWSRDEWWAAAVALESSGASHYSDRALTSNVTGNAGDLNSGERFSSEDPWTRAVLTYAATQKEYVTADGALTYGVLMPVERQDKRARSRCKAILRRHLGIAVPMWIEGRVQRGYNPPGSNALAAPPKERDATGNG